MAPYFLNGECSRLSTGILSCHSCASGNCNEVKRSRIQLMDDRNPYRNTAKVTKSSVARGRL